MDASSGLFSADSER